MQRINRRKFIGQAGCAALGSWSILNTLINLKAVNFAALGNPNVVGGDYKALVCLFMNGGNDAFNMLIPTDDDRYMEYQATRSNLALDRNDLYALEYRGGRGQTFGLHGSMPNMGRLFDRGEVAFINNVGTLIEPIVQKQEVWQMQKKLPLGLYSHSDQSKQWQTAHPHDRDSLGWGGRIADVIHSVNDSSSISMNISLSGTNVFQTGEKTIEYTLHPTEGSLGIIGYDTTNQWNRFDLARTRAIDEMLAQQYADAFKKAYVDPIRTARDGHILFQEGLLGLAPFQTVFLDDDANLSRRFEMIAKTIAMRDFLGFKRQIFFVELGGWDHHDEVLGNQSDMLSLVDDALNSFNHVLKELQVEDCVTTFTISEFGRTLTSNGNGTDHAWGGNVMVMGGGQVNGGKMYGDYPSLALGSEREIGSGILIPSTSADEYFAELAMWFGVGSSELTTIFPNLSNFYTIGSTQPPLGFLNI